jgi:hypothetical protein
MNLRNSALLLVVCLCVVACSTESSTPTNLPYAAAKENLARLDYDAALKNLEKTIKADPNTPEAKQASILRIALLTSMAQGARDMADAYDTGLKQSAARNQSSLYTRMRSDYYGIARVYLMNAMETVLAQRPKLTADPLPLDAAFPEFSGLEPSPLDRIRHAMSVQESERVRAEVESSRNHMAGLLAALSGAGEDVHKGKGTFQKGPVPLDTRVYLLELSAAFYKLREIFEPKALDDVRYLRTTIEVVQGNLDALDQLLAVRPDKDMQARAKKLRTDCDAALKKIK